MEVNIPYQHEILNPAHKHSQNICPMSPQIPIQNAK